MADGLARSCRPELPAGSFVRSRAGWGSAFEEALLRWDFGKLRLGPVQFGSKGDYAATLLENNAPGDPEFWERWSQPGEDRPKHRLMIGGSDPHTVILHTDDGSVGAFVVDDGSTTERRVARDFELFFRGLGTLFFTPPAERPQLVGELCAACGADPASRFWHGHCGVYLPQAPPDRSARAHDRDAASRVTRSRGDAS